MTNTEMWLDETISHIKSVKSDIWMLHEIMSLPNCNDCKNKDCEYKPKWGEHIRYNCPLHTDRKAENSSENPNNSTISKMEQVDKDINVRSKDEPQPNADQHVQRIEYVGNDEKSRCWTCKHFERMHETPISSDGSYYTYVVCTAKECKYEPKDEPQPGRSSE